MLKRSEAREIAFKTIYSKFFNSDPEELIADATSSDFVLNIVNSYTEHENEIKELISSHLKGYTLERVYKIDLAILIVALVEINYIKENPKEVVINEAVELAKKFSTEKSPKFINGVLADIIK